MIIANDKKHITATKLVLVIASLVLAGCWSGRQNEDKEQSLRNISKVTKLFIPDTTELIGYSNLFGNDESIHARIQVSNEDYRFFKSSLPQKLIDTRDEPDKILYDSEAPSGADWWVPSELLNPRGRIMHIDSHRTLTVLVGDMEDESSYDVYIYFVGP